MQSTRKSNATDPLWKRRLQKTLIRYAVILTVGIAYLIFVLCTGEGIPCILYTATGLQCPGCGISRMLVSLVQLDLAAAFAYNPFLLVTSPLLLGLLFLSDYRFVRYGDASLGKAKILLWIELILLLLFGVVRNLI